MPEIRPDEENLNCEDINHKLNKLSGRLIRLEENNQRLLELNHKLTNLQRSNKRDNNVRLWILASLALAILSFKFEFSGTIHGITFKGGSTDDANLILNNFLEILLNLFILGTSGAAGVELFLKRREENREND